MLYVFTQMFFVMGVFILSSIILSVKLSVVAPHISLQVKQLMAHFEAPGEVGALGTEHVLCQLGLLRVSRLCVQHPAVQSGNHELESLKRVG